MAMTALSAAIFCASAAETLGTKTPTVCAPAGVAAARQATTIAGITIRMRMAISLKAEPTLGCLDGFAKRQAQPGFQPRGASSKPAKSKPGATVQPTSVQAPRLSAACQAPAGTTACGR